MAPARARWWPLRTARCMRRSAPARTGRCARPPRLRRREAFTASRPGSSLFGRGMGLLDDAIREHLELKRSRGADPNEVERQEREALGATQQAEFVESAEADSIADSAEVEADPVVPVDEPERFEVDEPEPFDVEALEPAAPPA